MSYENVESKSYTLLVDKKIEAASSAASSAAGTDSGGTDSSEAEDIPVDAGLSQTLQAKRYKPKKMLKPRAISATIRRVRLVFGETLTAVVLTSFVFLYYRLNSCQQCKRKTSRKNGDDSLTCM